MTYTNAILSIVPGLQATALVGRAYKMVPKKWVPEKKGSKTKWVPKNDSKKFIKGFVDLSVGVALMKPTASMINSMK